MHRYRKLYHRLTPLSAVVETVEEKVSLKPKGTELIEISRAVNRVLAEDVRAAVNIPPFNRSMVDGYAVISDDLSEAYENNPVKLRVVGRIFAGERPKIEFKHGECVEVATGALIPYPADAVVPVEFTRKIGDDEILVYNRVGHGENVDYVGSDAVVGEVIVHKGTVLTPELIGSIASIGIRKVRVYSQVSACIYSIGNELVEPGERIIEGQIYDSNAYMVAAHLQASGVSADIRGIIADDFREIKEKIDEALQKYDVVITIGGTSAGLEDITYKVASTYNPGIIVHGVKIKPGRPTFIAANKDKLIVGLPGFPFSCLVASELILIPIISKITGVKGADRRVVEAFLLAPVRGKPGLTRIIPVLVRRRSDTYFAYPFMLRSSSAIKLTSFNGFLTIPEGIEGLSKDAKVKVILRRGYREEDIVFVGSHCPLAEELFLKLRGKYNVKYLFVGSTGGLRVLKTGISDIAGSHLLDPETGQYNIPFIHRHGLKNVVVVRGYYREQGFIARKDALKKVDSILDIIKNNYRFINRNKGSGTRVLVDLMIKNEAEELGISFREIRNRIRGYWFEARNHYSVASLIKAGRADIGVAIKYVAVLYGLDFKPISREIYDFIFTKNSLKHEPIRDFLAILSDKAMEDIVKKYPGYHLHPDSGKVIYSC